MIAMLWQLEVRGAKNTCINIYQLKSYLIPNNLPKVIFPFSELLQQRQSMLQLK